MNIKKEIRVRKRYLTLMAMGLSVMLVLAVVPMLVGTSGADAELWVVVQNSPGDVTVNVNAWIETTTVMIEASSADNDLAHQLAKINSLALSTAAGLGGVRQDLGGVKSDLALLRQLIYQYEVLNGLQYNAIDKHKDAIFFLRIQQSKLENIKASSQLLDVVMAGDQQAKLDDAIFTVQQRVDDEYNRIKQLERDVEQQRLKILSIYEQLIYPPTIGYFDQYYVFRRFDEVKPYTLGIFRVTAAYSDLGECRVPLGGTLTVEGVECDGNGGTNNLRLYIWNPVQGQREVDADHYTIERDGGFFRLTVEMNYQRSGEHQLRIERVENSREFIILPFTVNGVQMGVTIPDGIRPDESFDIAGYVNVQRPVSARLSDGDLTVSSEVVEPDSQGHFTLTYTVPQGEYRLTLTVWLEGQQVVRTVDFKVTW